MILREAVEADLPGILEIHNHAIRHTTALWTETPADLTERQAWFTQRRASGYPVLVAEQDGRVAAFASFGDFRPKEGYRHTVEHSVYVHPDYTRRGLGRALLTQLIERARQMGKHAMVAGIEAGNVASLRLHEQLGFREVGRLEQVGTKFGRWLDLAFMQLQLDDRPAPGENHPA